MQKNKIKKREENGKKKLRSLRKSKGEAEKRRRKRIKRNRVIRKIK